MDPIVADVLKSVGAAVGVSTVLAVGIARPWSWRRRHSRHWTAAEPTPSSHTGWTHAPPDHLTDRLAGAAAIAGGYLVAHYLVRQVWPGLQPHLAVDWAFYAAIVGVVLGVVETVLYRGGIARRIAAWVVHAAFVVGFLLAVSLPLMKREWRPIESAGWTLLAGIGLTAWWATMDRASRLMTPSAFLALILILFSGSSAVLFFAGSLDLARLAGALAAAAGPVLALTLIWPGRPLPVRARAHERRYRPSAAVARGAIAVAALVWTVLFAVGLHYIGDQGQPRIVIPALLGPALLAWLAASIPAIHRATGSDRVRIRFAAGVIPPAIAALGMAAVIALAIYYSPPLEY